jgi:hypothetical protein
VRSNTPIPGNPWPHDMVLTVDDYPNNIAELLFVRSAWGLDTATAIPELESAPEAGSASVPDSATPEEWARRWDTEWARAMDWYLVADRTERPTQEILLQPSQPGQPLHPSFPPFWSVEYGGDGIDRMAVASWQQSLRGDMMARMKAEPERRSLPQVITAWEGGLERIVTLPYRGYYADRIDRRTLVVSDETRMHPESYARALATAV